MATITVKLASNEKVEKGDCLAGGVVKVAFPGEPWVVVERDDYEYSAFEDDPRVVEHHPEQTVKPLGIVVPDHVGTLAAYNPGDTFPMIGVNDDVLRASNYGADIVLAVVDTGVYGQHEAFAGKNIFGDLEDVIGHGSHVAGTAASAIGVASDATILSKRVLDGPNGTGSESGVALGLQAVADWAIANKTNVVINMSLGGGPSGVIDAGVRYCQQRGVWVVAAAGNDGPNAVLGSPARAADFIVGAVDRNSTIANFSSGNGTWQQISCYMPGVNISSVKFGTTNQYQVMSGTSMATPHLAGVLCLLRRAGMTLLGARDYIAAHQSQIGAANRKGLVVLKSDFSSAAPPVEPPPPASVDWEVEVQGITAEIRRIVTDAQQKGWKSVDVESQLGSIKDYTNQIDALLPKVPEQPTVPPVEPPPAPPPVTRIIAPGQTVTRNTGRNSMRVSVPNTSQTDLWTALVFAGTGFQGATLGMLPLDLELNQLSDFHTDSVGNQFTQNGIIYAECAYRGGAVAGQVDDALAAYDLAVKEAESWGGNPAKICIVGHSSGGFLCARIAEERPDVKFAMIMSGAALKVNGYNWPAQSQQLLASAGVNENNAPITYLPKAKGKMTLAFVVAQQDEQIPPQSEIDYANAAQQAGHSVSIYQVPGMHGASITPGLQWAVQIMQKN